VGEAEPDRKTGWRRSNRLYTRTERWAELVDIVRGEIRLADSDAQIIDLTFRLAQILEVALGDMPKAVEAYQDILNIYPKHAETRATLERVAGRRAMQHEIAQVLEPLYRAGEEWEKLRGSIRSSWVSSPTPRSDSGCCDGWRIFAKASSWTR